MDALGVFLLPRRRTTPGSGAVSTAAVAAVTAARRRVSTSSAALRQPVPPAPTLTSLTQPPRRSTWDHQRIDHLARSSEVYEKQFGAHLQTQLGADYVVEPHANKFNRHDYVVYRRDSPDRKVWVELECGVTQTQWTTSLSDNRAKWVQGLNVLSRKIAEGQHFDLFIKHNKTGQSFFAATYEFIKTHASVHRQSRHSLGFTTDNVVYSLPWSYVDQPSHAEFCFDDFSRLQRLLDQLLQRTQ